MSDELDELNELMEEPGFAERLLWTLLMLWLSCFTLSWLWQWFIVPFGVQSISMPHAGGLTILMAFCQSGRDARRLVRQWYIEKNVLLLILLVVGFLLSLGM